MSSTLSYLILHHLIWLELTKSNQIRLLNHLRISFYALYLTLPTVPCLTLPTVPFYPYRANLDTLYHIILYHTILYHTICIPYILYISYHTPHSTSDTQKKIIQSFIHSFITPFNPTDQPTDRPKQQGKTAGKKLSLSRYFRLRGIGIYNLDLAP